MTRVNAESSSLVGDEVSLHQSEISGGLSGDSGVSDVSGGISPRALRESCRSLPHLGTVSSLFDPMQHKGGETKFFPLVKVYTSR